MHTPHMKFFSEPLNPLHNAKDHELYNELVRDACLLFHQLGEYGYIMETLDFRGDFPRPYWEVINRVDTGCSDDRLIRSGILILFLAGVQDELQQSGVWISEHSQQIVSCLKPFVPEDYDMLRLSEAVLHGLSILSGDGKADDRFEDDYAWAYGAFVRRYFQDKLGRG